MMPAFKWVTLAWVAVLVACWVCGTLALSGELQPLAVALLYALIPVVLPPLLLAFAVMPNSASLLQFLGLAALAIYLWLLGFVCLAFVVKAWHQRYGAYDRPRLPTVAMY